MAPADVIARERTATGEAGRAATGWKRVAPLLRPLLMGGGLLVVAIGGLLFWLWGGRYVYSDDTYVDAAKVALSTDVSGLVNGVSVRDNQHVGAGQLLFKIGQDTYDIAVKNAQAQLDLTVQQINAARTTYRQNLAQIETQKVAIAKDQADLARYAAVLHEGGVTRETYDNARFALQSDQARLAELQADMSTNLTKLNDNPEILTQETPQYRTALQNLASAELNQTHSVVRAPFSGYVTSVEQLQRGMFLPAGTAAFGLVSDTDMWITSQPKESQLTWVRSGQPVDITIDTYPGQHWKGVVESLSPASGSEFSVLPAQNSSGNWVKVVQRIPVRIKILSGPAEFPLRDGMSAEVSIDTGHRRHLSDLF